MSRITPAECGGVNVCAFLDMIAHSEGTSTVSGSDDGYNVLVGGGLFFSYATHPLSKGLFIKALGYSSTAAGRYQLLNRYFEPYARLLHLPDFGPMSQDLIAIQQIKERDAYELMRAGAFAEAVKACKGIWASLPGAGYGQRENSITTLEAVFRLRVSQYESA